MTLLITVFAAVIVTAKWYQSGNNDMNYKPLIFMYWGATLMWFVDAIFEYVELKAAYFTPDPKDMLNDTFLGLSVVALGLVIWVVILLIKDPRGKSAETLKKDKNNK